MKKYMGPAKALKRIGSVAERHTEDHEDVAESRVATTRRTGFWRTLGHQRAKRTSTGNLSGFANASGGRMLIGVSGDRNRRILPKGVKAWSVRRGFAGTDPARGAFYG